MFISQFSRDNWQQNQNKETIQSANNWQTIENAIMALNGNQRTLVTLETEDETHLAIGGGPTRFVVYVTFDNETFSYLVNPTYSNLEIQLVVGGQVGLYPIHQCVTIQAVLEVAKTFAELGKMNLAFIWEKQGILEPV
ncbi:MAG: Imm1 family immunity protein [Microcystaceae cyanobacterium]